MENDYDMDCNENVDDEASEDAGDKVGRKTNVLSNNLHASTCTFTKTKQNIWSKL